MKLAESPLLDEARAAMDAYVLAQAEWFTTPTDDGALQVERARLGFEEVARRLAVHTAAQESAMQERIAKFGPALSRMPRAVEDK
jgi:hypothetical protein